jgi:hypothetical protein
MKVSIDSMAFYSAPLDAGNNKQFYVPLAEFSGLRAFY